MILDACKYTNMRYDDISNLHIEDFLALNVDVQEYKKNEEMRREQEIEWFQQLIKFK